MATRKLSPMANLLRTSRLFSLPPPLDRPDPDVNQGNDTPTATLPYPTHAAIESTAASRSRGDWGLKRPLPLRTTTKTSTSHLNLKNFESIDQIIDFESATGYTKTLEKFQSLALAVSGINRTKASKNVFDSKADQINKENAEADTERWRFEGPWLPSLSRGEFQDYIHKQIRRKRNEFRKFIQDDHRQKATAAARRQAIEEGLEEGQQFDSSKVPEKDANSVIRELRQDPSSTKLEQQVTRFLDIPPLPSASSNRNLASEGPPTSHPSAGISYLRSHAHTYNHPLYGPQENKPPVQARVLAAQAQAQGAAGFWPRKYAVFGVGGMTANDRDMSFAGPKADRLKEGEKFVPGISGGAKLWVHPQSVAINSQKRIQLVTARSEQRAQIALGVASEDDKIANVMHQASQLEQMPRLSSGSLLKKEGKSTDHGLGRAFSSERGRGKSSYDRLLDRLGGRKPR